ncbi:MAG: prepilin peptidase [Candidatus Methylacidiphilales bacterium]
MTPITLFATVGFGACIGSFLNVVIYRLPLGRSIVYPGSHCAACGRALKWYWNIPVFSWLFLRGQAACCGARIDMRYPMVEALTALLTVVVWHSFPPAQALVYLIFIYALVVGTFIDLDYFIIPDSVSLGGCFFGLAASLWVWELHGAESLLESFQASALGMAAGGLGLWLVAVLGAWLFKKDAMGLGDVKLLAAIGALCGWKGVVFTIASASMLGSIIGLVVIMGRAKKSGVPIPFGPFLAGGCLLYILRGHQWFADYLASMGFGSSY